MDTGRKLSCSNLGNNQVDKMTWYPQAEGGLRFNSPEPPLVSVSCDMEVSQWSLSQAIHIVRRGCSVVREAPQTTWARAKWVSQSDFGGLSVKFRLDHPGSTTWESAWTKRMSCKFTHYRPEEHPATRWTRDILPLASSCCANMYIPMGQHEVRGPSPWCFKDLKATQPLLPYTTWRKPTGESERNNDLK